MVVTTSCLRVITVCLNQTANVWRQVAFHQATCAIAFRLKVASQLEFEVVACSTSGRPVCYARERFTISHQKRKNSVQLSLVVTRLLQATRMLVKDDDE